MDRESGGHENLAHVKGLERKLDVMVSRAQRPDHLGTCMPRQWFRFHPETEHRGKTEWREHSMEMGLGLEGT